MVCHVTEDDDDDDESCATLWGYKLLNYYQMLSQIRLRSFVDFKPVVDGI